MKTAQDLSIKTWEYQRLLQVREMLAKMPHVTYRGRYTVRGNCFNMEVTLEPHECGTVCCIGGWVKLLEIRPDTLCYYRLTHDEVIVIQDYVHVERSNALKPLYFPSSTVSGDDLPEGIDYCQITPAQAVAAIGRFLDGETDPRILWREAMEI